MWASASRSAKGIASAPFRWTRCLPIRAARDTSAAMSGSISGGFITDPVPSGGGTDRTIARYDRALGRLSQSGS
eukprot:4827110-Prymnesium_polylepis.1